MTALQSSGNRLPKYDAVTLWLHGALAAGVVIELALLSVMRVPAGVGLGVHDWHREAFEIHCRVGPTVTIVWVVHGLWICLPCARPGVGYLFPWLRRARRAILVRELKDLLRCRLPGRDELSPLVGAVQGLGLCALGGSVAGGMISYLAYFRGVPMPERFLHEVALEQIVMSWLVWAFFAGHISMAARHFLLRPAPAGPAMPTHPDTGAS
ncbi:MAG: cytochrome b/b6 domain-containing protein [Steroidobacteraceae bacterium]